MEDKRNAYKVLIGKGEEKRQLRTPRHRRIYIFKEQTWVERRGLDSSGAGNREVAGPEHQNQTFR
jgi:hypothetical protein